MILARHFVWLRLALLGLLAAGRGLCATTICATVLGPGEHPVENARVVARNLETNDVTILRTDHAGKACTPRLAEGLYSVEVSQEGYMNVRYSPLRVWYPEDQELSFRLPLGDITEGGVNPDAILSGTLRKGETVVEGVDICAFKRAGGPAVDCTVTNDLGQYAMNLPPGSYRIRVSTRGGLSHHPAALLETTIELQAGGFYRNAIQMDKKERPGKLAAGK